MGYTFSYNNFPAKTFLNSMNAMSAMMGELNDDEELECPFDTMSGVIKTKGAIDNLDMNIDLTLKGGGVKTLKLYVNTDDNEATVIVNGQEYSNLEEVFEDL
ncbi:MAG TPA: hypothetical protein VFC68_02405 [Treponemataceae bacterium]|nr:hypothetical protein [Treponemataceae bacterium]